METMWFPWKVCLRGDIGQTQESGVADSFMEDPSVGVGDIVKDRRLAGLAVPHATYHNCPSGYSLDGTTGTYRGTVYNFDGGTAVSPVLTLRAP